MPTTIVSNLYTKKVTDLDLDSTAEQIDTGAKTLFGVTLDNSQNVAVSYAKFYNSAAPTVGTTSPELVCRIAAGALVDIILSDDGSGSADGWTGAAGSQVSTPQFGTALSVAGVTTGGVAGSTPPANDFMANVFTN